MSRGVSAIERSQRDVLLLFFCFPHVRMSFLTRPNVRGHLPRVSVNVTVTAVEGNEGIVHCVISE